MTKHIAILRGDGIGPEIVAETVRVLDKLIAQGLSRIVAMSFCEPRS